MEIRTRRRGRESKYGKPFQGRVPVEPQSIGYAIQKYERAGIRIRVYRDGKGLFYIENMPAITGLSRERLYSNLSSDAKVLFLIIVDNSIGNTCAVDFKSKPGFDELIKAGWIKTEGNVIFLQPTTGEV